MAEHNNLMKKKYLQQLLHTRLRQPFIYFASNCYINIGNPTHPTLPIMYLID